MPLSGFYNAAEKGGWSPAYTGDGDAAFAAFCTAAAVGASVEGACEGEGSTFSTFAEPLAETAHGK